MMLLLYVLSCLLVIVVSCNRWLCFESTCCLVGCFMSSDVSELNTSIVVCLLLFMSGRRWRSAILLHESGAACWFDIFVIVLYVVTCVILHVREGVRIVWRVDVCVCADDGCNL